ncbi:odorant receptor 30a-like isoform X1 [Linepithema humile]|uniref:odorant receptor 30a-like isoform X1 n=1 Tax=Linepithema humile TaxID=83485 RepID=UPI00351ECE60
MYLDVYREMICIKPPQVSLQVLLLVVGLWPFQQSKFVQLQLIIFFSILITFIVFQLTTFVTLKCTTHLVINVFSSVLIYIIFIVKYSSFFIHNDVVKCLLEQLQRTCDQLTDENEINIIKKYNTYTKCYITLCTMLFIVVGFVIILYPFWPRILDILLPTNESRPHPSLLLVTEYFVDQEKYFYLMMLHAIAASSIGGIAVLATAMILLACQHHACGMFRIASYRVEQAMTVCNSRRNCLKSHNLIYKGLIYAVDMHRKAMKFSQLSLSRFKVMIFLIISIGVICSSLNYFRIFHALSFGFNIEELVMPVLFVAISFVYLMISNYCAQEIMEHNDDVFITVYSGQWYLTPVHVQKMVLFLLQRSTKAFTLNLGRLFVGSLESAAMLLSTIFSYFTVIYSTQR